MKKIILPFTFCAMLFMSFAFTGTTPCDGNDMFIKGTVAKTGMYKADGTLQGTNTSTVSDVTTSGDSTISVMQTSYVDAKKPDQQHAGEVRFICIDNKIIMDMSGMMNSMAASSGKDMKVVMTGNLVPYATSYTAGQKLDDLKMKMDMYNNGSLMMTSDITVTNRVCEAVEDRTTPAGTFHCFKISQVTTAVTKMGAITMPGSGKPDKSIQWFSPKSGVVRMESYKDDKLFSYNELISLVKP